MIKKKFIESYRLEEVFSKAHNKGLTWKKLISIYNDYKKTILPIMNSKQKRL